MASKLSLGRSRMSKSVTITRTRSPNFAHFRRQMSPCAEELVTHTISILHRLALLEFIQPVADLACILRVRNEEKKDVMKKVVYHEQPDDARRRQEEYRNSIQELLLCTAEAAFSVQ